MKKKDTRLNLRASAEQVQRLMKAAQILETPTSEFIRRTLDKELDRLAKRHPELERAAA